jgi:hypothetical protein
VSSDGTLSLSMGPSLSRFKLQVIPEVPDVKRKWMVSVTGDGGERKAMEKE